MFITKDHRHIVVPWRQDLARVMPHAKEFIHNGEQLLLVPNEHDEAKLARNLGVPVPAPVLTRYDWRGLKPWDVQKATTALLTEQFRAYVLNAYGTGKTRAVIWAADYLRTRAKVGRVLIAAPLSTLTPVWAVELFKVLPRARVQILHGSKRERLDRLAEDADFYIINHHGLKLITEELIKRSFDVFVIDELATFRNRGTHLWKAAKALVESGISYCWGLTGSPTPKAPTDAWAQVKLLTPNRVTSSFVRFRDLTMKQVSNFAWVKRPGAGERVREAMQPSVRFSLEDVMELPETIYQKRRIELDPIAAKAYKLLFDKMALLTTNGETVTAVNEGVLQNKLLQVSLGYIYSDHRAGVIKLPNDTRLDAIREAVEGTEQKAIVFAPYLHALEHIADFLSGYASVAKVDGGTSVGKRNDIFRQFQSQLTPRVIVAHPGCMSHGLTLTAANTIVWAGPVNSYETYEQANARIVRPGQSHKTLILHLIGTPVEQLCYRRLEDRGTFQGLLLDLFQRQALEF